MERLTSDNLQNIVINTLDTHPTMDASGLRYLQGLILLRHYLGGEWCDQYLEPGTNPVQRDGRAGRLFSRTDATSVNDRFRHQDRVERLAELLYNLQDVQGIEERRASIQQGDVESTYAELEFAGHFISRGVGLRFLDRSGVKGKDYDFEAWIGAHSVCCEVKCKLEGTDLSENTIINSLNKARKQTPTDRPSIIGVKIPESWASNPALRADFESALTEFFRNSGRVVSVVLRWEQVAQLPSGHGLIQNRFRFHQNDDARNLTDGVRQLILRLTKPAVGNWTSLRASVSDSLPHTFHRRETMRSLQFNISGSNQHAVFENPDHGLNPPDSMTVEALCELLEDGEDPTIFSLPANEKWEAPFVAWRLGFHGQDRVPEFQVTIEGDAEPTTARSTTSVGKYKLVHLAGTYDGSAVRLYVNGKLEAEVGKSGKVMRSTQKAALAARSSTSLGGLFVGRLSEMRFWKIARPAAEIDAWKDKSLPLPAPDGLVSLWKTEPALDADQANHLAAQGFSPIEISLSSFAAAYADAYSTIAPDILTGVAKEQFARKIHSTLMGKAADGYVVLYEPSPPELLAGITDNTEMTALGGFFAFDWSEHTLSDVLQMMSGNCVKICTRTEEDGIGRVEIPKDRDDTVATSVNPRLKEAAAPLPQIHIVVEPGREGSGLRRRGRVRINSPLVTLEGGDTVRAFPWLFADIWHGELSWDIAQIGLSDKLATNDLLELNVFAGGAPVAPPKVVEVKTDQPLFQLERIIADFEALIAREDVEEVRDVLPFLGKPEHWIILSPTAQHVWPEKMLGNKWRVDFVVRESDGTYTAIEVESPKKRLYKTGKAVEPYAEWTHAEQQVRDYCSFIDANRDYVEREEDLNGILRPRGLVIIGRRETLTKEGKKKLAERNADNERYQTITFDDLLDQAKAVVQRLMALIAPKSL